MKKKLFLSIVVILLGCGSLVAKNDGFFVYNNDDYREENNEWGVMPSIPGFHGSLDDCSCVEAPLGNGFLLLAGMALTYSAARRRKS